MKEYIMGLLTGVSLIIATFPWSHNRLIAPIFGLNPKLESICKTESSDILTLGLKS